eukprot:g13359.t1 g13359   contig8:485418-487020(-)
MHYMASQSTVGLNEAEDDRLHEEHLALQSLMSNPIAYHAEMMGDIMYFHQAMKQPDSEEFVKAVVKEWSLRQVDFVMAYTQAPIEMDMYMELPAGLSTKHGDSKSHVLKLLANLYGQKQAGRVWNEYLVGKLRSIGFEQSKVDDCIFYRGDAVFIVYVDDGMFWADVTDNLQTVPFTQRAIIDSVIDVGLDGPNIATKPVPAKSTVHLHAHKSSPTFNGRFNYRSVVGKLNYLAQTTRPDIMYATHQIAKYSSDPRKEHGEAIIYLVRYLKGTRHLGLKFKVDRTKGFECYVDADFAGAWNRAFAATDPSTAKSRGGWIVFYAGCPIIWASKLQTQVALSRQNTSQCLWHVIPIMELVREMKNRKFEVICTEPLVYCKVFEDNSGALELARLPKLPLQAHQRVLPPLSRACPQRSHQDLSCIHR